MHREHEDHMRVEYETFHRLEADMYEVGTDAEIDRIDAQRGEIARRWQQGPHAEHWDYLDDARQDWRQAPDTMHRFLDNITHQRRIGWSAVSDVQFRSLEQARELTGNDRPRQRPQRER